MTMKNIIITLIIALLGVAIFVYVKSAPLIYIILQMR